MRVVPTPFIGKPNDPRFSRQWSLHNDGLAGRVVDADIDALEAWEITTGRMATIVAIADSGVDYTHPDLYLNIWLNEKEIPPGIASKLKDADRDGLLTFRDLNAATNGKHVRDHNENGYIDAGDLLSDPAWENGVDEDGNGYPDDLIGWDFRDDDNDPFDTASNQHGTRFSLLVGGIGNNGIGGAGLNWQIRIVAIRIRAGGEEIVNSKVARGFDYSVTSRASIVTAGFRGNPRRLADEFSGDIFCALKRTRHAGLLVITGAGNGARNTDRHPWYPQGYQVDNTITAAALNGSGNQLSLSNLTNWGARSVDLAVATTNGTTSHAGALTTGVAALIKSQHPDWNYRQIKNRMLQTVDRVPSLVGKTVTGGRLNAAKALGVRPNRDK